MFIVQCKKLYFIRGTQYPVVLDLSALSMATLLRGWAGVMLTLHTVYTLHVHR